MKLLRFQLGFASLAPLKPHLPQSSLTHFLHFPRRPTDKLPHAARMTSSSVQIHSISQAGRGHSIDSPTPTQTMKRVLLIAGSDSSGGA